MLCWSITRTSKDSVLTQGLLIFLKDGKFRVVAYDLNNSTASFLFIWRLPVQVEFAKQSRNRIPFISFFIFPGLEFHHFHNYFSIISRQMISELITKL